MLGNGGFPPIQMIKKEKDKNVKIKERLFIDKRKIVKINDIITNVKKPMIDMDKEEIKIINSFE